jgi:hypothetical protein
MEAGKSNRIFDALKSFRIELPSWGFANTGTRFGKFIQPAAATSTEEKFSDAGQVHLLTGVCPTVALHVLWDCPDGVRSADDVKKYAERYGILSGSINPIFSRTRNINTAPLAILTPQFVSEPCNIPKTASRSPGDCTAEIFPCGLRTAQAILERRISGNASNGSQRHSEKHMPRCLPDSGF